MAEGPLITCGGHELNVGAGCRCGQGTEPPMGTGDGDDPPIINRGPPGPAEPQAAEAPAPRGASPGLAQWGDTDAYHAAHDGRWKTNGDGHQLKLEPHPQREPGWDLGDSDALSRHARTSRHTGMLRSPSSERCNRLSASPRVLAQPVSRAVPLWKASHTASHTARH